MADEWDGWGSISQHRARDGRIRWRLRGWLDGRRQPFGLFDTREEAEEKRLALIELFRVERGGAGAGLTLATWGTRWLNRREVAGHRASKSDRSRWATHVASSFLAPMLLRRITRAHVLRWVRELIAAPAKRAKWSRKTRTSTSVETGKPISHQTARHALNLLRSALRAAADDELVASNVAADVRLPPNPGRTDEGWTYLELEEIAALASLPVLPADRERVQPIERALRAEQRSAILVAVYTGLRAGELWGLRWCDVILDGPRPELVVCRSYRRATKSGSVRRVPLLAPAREALREWQARCPGIGEAPVWPADGGGVHGRGYDAGWGEARARAGITRRVRWHDLRHTCASHLVSGSWGPAQPLTAVGAWLGHRDLQTTQRYAHLRPEALHRARAETDAALAAGHQVATAEILDLRTARRERE